MTGACIPERSVRDLAAAGYEAWYRESKGAWFDAREKSMFVRAIQRASFPQPVRVLDAGCGTGRVTEAIVPHAASIVSLDFSHQSLTTLHAKRLANAHPVEADGAQLLPLRSQSFDVVVCCQVLQHMPLAALLQLMREFRRVLKENGRLLLSVYNLGYWRFHGLFEQIDDTGLYYRRFNRAHLRYLARCASFHVDSIAHYKCLPARWPWPERSAGSLDRALCAIPGLRNIMSVYLFAELRKKPLPHGRGSVTG